MYSIRIKNIYRWLSMSYRIDQIEYAQIAQWWYFQSDRSFDRSIVRSLLIDAPIKMCFNKWTTYINIKTRVELQKWPLYGNLPNFSLYYVPAGRSESNDGIFLWSALNEMNGMAWHGTKYLSFSLLSFYLFLTTKKNGLKVINFLIRSIYTSKS